MKKNFTSAAEELIAGIPSAVTDRETADEPKETAKGGYLRYIEPRSERMNLLLSKSTVKKLQAEAKNRRISNKRQANEILQNYFSNK